MLPHAKGSMLLLSATEGKTLSYRIESSVQIMAPPEVVWETIQSVSRRIEWDARVIAVELLTPPPVGKGAHTRVSYRMFGIPLHIELEMIVWNPPHRSAVSGVFVGRADRIAGSWHVDRNPDGSTTWISRLMLTGGGRFAKLRERINGPTIKRLTIISQQNLKRLVELEYNHAEKAPAREG
jgi:hypothetical protein